MYIWNSDSLMMFHYTGFAYSQSDSLKVIKRGLLSDILYLGIMLGQTNGKKNYENP